MSNGEQETQTPEEIRRNTQVKVAELAAQLQNLDDTEGAQARELLNLYSALHADPSGNAKSAEGKTAAEVYAEYEALSKSIGEKRAPLEQQMNDFSKGLALVADYQTLRKMAKERAEASAQACQEPPRDVSEFSNPELDRIRSKLQTNPLPGGDTASIDDGSAGSSSGNASDSAQQQQQSAPNS